MTINPDGADNRGYLREPFRLFHLSDQGSRLYSYHYHEFHKVIALWTGEVRYQVEGRGYRLTPESLLLVPAHAIHQAEQGDGVYHRTVLWIQTKELEERGLERCFLHCQKQNAFLLEKSETGELLPLLSRLEESLRDESAFGQEVLTQALFLQFLVLLNRRVLEERPKLPMPARADPEIDEILAYINGNLTAELSVEALARRFFLSRSWLMHRFKEILGCTIHQYVLQKRLILAVEHLRAGETVTAAASASGFAEYSTFLRAFKRVYGVSPSEFGPK